MRVPNRFKLDWIRSQYARRIEAILTELGEYPHAALSPLATSSTPKQGTRMLKLECVTTGYIVRTTAKWLDEYGVPICPCCQEPMEREDWAKILRG